MAQRAGPESEPGPRSGRRAQRLLIGAVAFTAVSLLSLGLTNRQVAIDSTQASQPASQPAPLAEAGTSPTPEADAEMTAGATTSSGDPSASGSDDATAVATAKPPASTRTPAPTPRRTRATARPTPRPVAGIRVPASIDARCSSNVSPELNAWIADRPNGSTLVFPPGSCYRLGGDAGLNLKGRKGLTLIGTGTTLQLRTTGATNFSSAFFLEDSDHITIRGFSVDGGNAATGTTGADGAINEHINGAAVRAGSSDVEFDRVKWDRLRGFGIFISDDGGGSWPSDVYIHDSTIRGGEMGIAITAGQRIRIVNNHIKDSVYIAIDLEPDQSQHGFRDVLIKGNDVTRYAWGQNLTSWFVAANPADAVVGSTVMDGLTITGNHVNIGAATADNGNADGLGGLGIRADKANLKRNVVITNNTTGDNDTQSASRGVIYLANVQNLTVTGNRQPIANGAGFVRDSGTSGTRTVSGNDLAP
jgi:cold shock CspA family protein